MDGFSTCIYDLKGLVHFIKYSDRIVKVVAYLIASTGNEEGLIKCIKYPIDIHGNVLYRIFPKGVKDEYLVAQTNTPLSDLDYYEFYNSFPDPHQMYRYIRWCLMEFKDNGVQMDFLNYYKKINLTVNIYITPEVYSLSVSEYDDDDDEEARIYAKYDSETFDYKTIIERIVDQLTSYLVPIYAVGKTFPEEFNWSIKLANSKDYIKYLQESSRDLNIMKEKQGKASYLKHYLEENLTNEVNGSITKKLNDVLE